MHLQGVPVSPLARLMQHVTALYQMVKADDSFVRSKT